MTLVFKDWVDASVIFGVVLVNAIVDFLLRSARIVSGDDQARTVAVNLFVFAAAAFLWNCRCLQQSSFSLGWMSNPWIWVGIGLTIATQLAFTYLPTMNVLFHSAAFGFNEWIAVLLVAAGIGLAVEAEKALQLRFNRVRVR